MAELNDIQNLEKELTRITRNFEDGLDKSYKKLQSFPKSAEELGKKMQGVVNPLLMIEKSLSKQQVYVDQLKIKEQDLTNFIQKAQFVYDKSAKLVEEEVALKEKLIGQNGKITALEKDRFVVLSKQSAKTLDQYKTATIQIKQQQSQLDELKSRNAGLNMNQAGQLNYLNLKSDSLGLNTQELEIQRDLQSIANGLTEKEKEKLAALQQKLIVTHDLQSEAAENIKELDALTSGLTNAEKARLSVLVEESAQTHSQQIEAKKMIVDQNKMLENVKSELASKEASLDFQKKIFAVFSTMMSLYTEYDKLLSENAKLQGVSKDEIESQYTQLQKNIKGQDIYRVSIKESLSIITSIRKEYSALSFGITNIVESAAALARASGVTSGEASKFYQTLAEISGTSLQTQENMEGIAMLAAKAANVPLGTVIKDVAQSSAGVRLIFRGNTTELIKQAAELRKIGSSLDSAAKSAEALLNFESSVGNELKASALLGKNVNFTESRRLFFAGNILEAEKELQRELEKIGDLDKLNYVQKKALSELTGKDIGELQKIQTAKKSLLEAEQMFPEEAAKLKAAQMELNSLGKSASELKKQEYATMLKMKTTETQSALIELAKSEALTNLGKALAPIGKIITTVEIAFFRLIGYLTSFNSAAVNVITGLGLLVGAFYLLKFGASTVLNFLGKLFAKSAESVGQGIGAGLKGISGGLTSLGQAMKSFSVVDMLKLVVLLGALGGTAWLLAKAFSSLGQTSAGQILAFTAALVVLGVGLAIVGALMTGPQILGVLGFAAALLLVGLGVMAIGKGLEYATPLFKIMVDAFSAMPEIFGAVIPQLVALALISPLLIVAAAGVVLLTTSLGLLGLSLWIFPTGKLTKISKAFARIGTSTTAINKLSESINKLSELNGISELSKDLIMLSMFKFDIDLTGIRTATSEIENLSGAVNDLTALSTFKDNLIIDDTRIKKATSEIESLSDALGDLNGLNLPKLDVDVKGADTLSKLNESKEKQSESLKIGLDAVVNKIDQLINMMSSGGIAVNIDGVRVSNQLAVSNIRSGGFGQSTTRIS